MTIVGQIILKSVRKRCGNKMKLKKNRIPSVPGTFRGMESLGEKDMKGWLHIKEVEGVRRVERPKITCFEEFKELGVLKNLIFQKSKKISRLGSKYGLREIPRIECVEHLYIEEVMDGAGNKIESKITFLSNQK